MPITVAITDDHPLALDGLRNMLSGNSNIVVTDFYETGEALLHGLTIKKPEVLLLDIQLPDMSGQELAGIIAAKYPEVKILVITSYDAPVHVKSMLRSGCMGYILKNTRRRSLVAAIEQVHKGETYIDPALQEQMIQHTQNARKQPNGKAPGLTHREKQILKLIVEEYTNQEIAARLFVSLRTVENHRFSLLQKLDVRNSIGLARVAIQLGLVD